MPQLGPIVRLRRRLTKNRLADLGRRRRLSVLALLCGGAVALVVGGHLAAPTLMEPPIDLATPRGLAEDELPAGAAALEAAFWLTALLASVLNFRVLELLFRRPDVVALQPLPIQPRALFVDRLAATTTEAVVAAAGASLFFLPLIWHGGAAAALACVAMLFGGLLFGAAVSLVVMLLATEKLVPDDGSDDSSRRPPLTDAYGGPGQLLLYAPAVALGGVVTLALFWKLLLGEPLRLGYASDPFLFGTAIVVGVSAACLFVAYRAFVDHYYAMAPRFHEVDAADFSAVADYQQSSFDTSRLWELGLPKGAALACRALLLDDDRRMAGGRVGYAVVMVLAVVGLATVELAALPLWAAAMVPAILIAAIVNPWVRVGRQADLMADPLGLPISPADRGMAADRVALREFLFVGVPYAVAVATILGYFRDVGTAGYLAATTALASGLGIAGGVAVARRLVDRRSVLRWLPVVLLVALTACAIVSLPATIALSLAAFVGALPLTRMYRSRHVDD